MQEARIIFPTTQAETLRVGIERYLSWIVDQFGGATVTHGRGLWRKEKGSVFYDEPIVIVDVAMDDTSENVRALRDIAETFRRAASETCVYVRLPNGQVEFVEGVWR